MLRASRPAPSLLAAAAFAAAAVFGGCHSEPAAQRPEATADATSSAPRQKVDAPATDPEPREPLAPEDEAAARREAPHPSRPDDATETRGTPPSPARPAPPPPAAENGAGVPPSEAIARASNEYHEKMQALRERYADNRDDPKFAQEVLELRRWFSREMRTVRMADRARREKAESAPDAE